MNDPQDPNEAEAVRLMKFAAGELGRNDENTMLLRCEAEPQRWRELALALVEERRLATALTGPATTVGPRPPQRNRAGLAWLATAACLGAIVGAGLMRSENQPEVAAAAPSTDHYVLIDSGVPAPVPVTPVTAAVLPLFEAEDYAAFERHGYRLKEEPIFYLVSDDEGRQITIPSKNITLTHVGR